MTGKRDSADSDRQSLRQLAVAFLRLPMTSRLAIADELNVAEGLDDVSDKNVEILRRIQACGKVGELRRLVTGDR